MPSARLALAPVAIFLLVVALYFPTLRGGFVYDSFAQVLHSDYIHTASHWADVLTLRVVGQDELDRNRPLHLASLMLDASIWGKNPFGYRLTSVLLHALNAALLFVFVVLFVRRTTGREDAAAIFSAGASPSAAAIVLIAAFGALFFALHPLVVEAVAEPSNREDLLVLLPLLAGLLVILAAGSPRSARGQFALNAALVLCSFLGVLAKESGVALPFIFALAAWMSGALRRTWPGLTGGLLAVGSFLLASYVFRPDASGIFTNSPPPLAGNFWASFLVQLRIWTLQLWQIFWPWNLSAHYPGEAVAGISAPLGAVVLAVAGVVAFLLRRTGPLAALGLAVFILALLPASNFVPQYHPLADRYLYVPLAGLGMIAAALAIRLRRQHPGRVARGVLLAAALLWLGAEYAANLRRQLIWAQPESLWTDVLRQFPRTGQAHFGLAEVHYRAGDFAAALASADQAVATSSGRWAEPFALRAICQWQTGQKSEALANFAAARRLSRAYRDEKTLAAALIFSPEQLAVLAELIAADQR